MGERGNSIGDSDHTHLVGEELGTLKVHVKVRWNEVVEFSDNTIMLGPVIAITSRVPWANLTEVFRIGLAEVRRTNPYLIEDAEETAKLIKLFNMLFEWV